MREKPNKDLDLATAMLYLQDLGVKVIVVEYSGGGDSGGIDSACCYSDLEFKNGVVVDKNEILDDIEQIAYAKLECIEDWYNNDGGWGEMIIHVPSGEYIINNNIRITETEEYIHEGSLTEEDE